MMQSFYGKDLLPIARFECIPGNYSSRTEAGRLQMLQAMQQGGAPISPTAAFHLLTKGSLEEITEPLITQDNLIAAENEKLANGEPVPAMPGDDPVLHIRGHLVVGYNPEVRFDQAKMQALNEHLQMHVQQMSQGDIFVKIASGQLPMGPFAPPGTTPIPGDTMSHPPNPPPPQQNPGNTGKPPSPGAQQKHEAQGNALRQPAKKVPPGPGEAPGSPLPILPRPQPLPELPRIK
jgi:hypothetical protein